MPVGLKPLAKLTPVKGVRISAVAAELRYSGRPDLVLMTCEQSAKVSTVFTANRYAAAPVLVARENLKISSPRALLINAGQANAGTGQPGVDIAMQSCQSVAEKIQCMPEQVLPFSTGVIGEAPPIKKINAYLPELISGLKEDGWNEAARGIMTTDTIAKGASQTVDVNGTAITITGIVKGSGMIHPNMATMLAFVATDAAIDQSVLDHCWLEVIGTTFNRITVDGDTSTNDAAVVIASGEARNTIIDRVESDECQVFKEALSALCASLAQGIIRDAEGATKFVTINVSGGSTEQDCLAIAFTIAHSPLVKTALFASDPNWGRILAAVGRAPVGELNIDSVDLFLGDICVAKGGAIDPDYLEAKGQAVMDQEEILIHVELNTGDAEATVWTSDLSHEYIKINAEYRS